MSRNPHVERNSPASAAWYRAGRGAAGIILAATIAGIAFNQMSPLGVRLRPARAAVKSEPPLLRVEDSPYAMQNYGVAWIAGGSAVADAVSATVSAQPAAAQVTWEEIAEAVQRREVLLVDARLSSQYVAGHIPGAISLPLTAPDADWNAFAAANPRARRIVVYCSNSECPMADKLAQRLREGHGFRNVQVLEGGFAAYRQAEAKRTSSAVGDGFGAEEEDF